MVSTTDIQHAEVRSTSAGLDFVAGGDRRKQFVSSRRHTKIVRALRLLLPVLVVGMVGVYVASAYQKAGFSLDVAMPNLTQIVPANLAMDNPRYSGFSSDGGAYVVKARRARPKLDNLNLVDLEGITGDLTDADKTKTRLTAKEGQFNVKRNILDLSGGIDIVSESGLRAQLSSARVKIKKNTVESSEPVQVAMPAGSIRSQSMLLMQKSKEATFTGDVVARLNPQPRAGAAESGVRQPGRALLGASGSPVEVTANRLDVKQQDGLAIFTGNVKTRQDAATMSTQELEIHFKNEGDAKPGAANPMGGAKVTRIVSKHPVLMTNGPQDQLTSNSAEFDAVNETALLVGNVVMTSGPERRVSGRRALLNSRSNTASILGDVIVRQGDSELRGGRLDIDRRDGTSQLTAPGEAGRKSGRISAVLVQGVPGDRKGKKSARQGSASKGKRKSGAGGFGIGAGTFKTTPGAPVEIDAVRLDVDDGKRQAVFSGAVVAKQGNFSLAAQKVVAHFSAPLGLADFAGQKKTSNKGPELSRIDARGAVRIKSSGGRSASGDWAEFDTTKNTAVVGGNVVLRQGDSQVRGDRLTINMTTGATVIDTTPGRAGQGWASTLRPGGASVSSKGKGKGNKSVLVPPNGIPIRGGRPSAVFFPQAIKGAGKEKAGGDVKSKAKALEESVRSQTNSLKKQLAPSAASSWDAVTKPRP